MKRVLLAFLLLAFIGCSTHAAPKGYPQSPTKNVSDQIRGSIVRLTGTMPEGQWICTAFSVAPRKYITAAHCTLPIHDFEKTGSHVDLKLDNHYAMVIKESAELDLSLVIADVSKPPVTFRSNSLTMYENVNAIGYGHGLSVPLITSNMVVALGYDMDAPGFVYPGTIFMNGFIGGMSGGPIYDVDGNIVGVVQRGSDFIGYGVDSKTVLDFINSK